MAMFFGTVVPGGGKATPFVPGGSPNDSLLHLSQASILSTAKEGKRASLLAKFGSSDADPICLATLTAGRLDSVALDIFLDRYTEFSVLGDVEVHLSGYFAPPDVQPTGDEDSDDDEEYIGEDNQEEQEGDDGEEEDGEEEEDEDDDNEEEGVQGKAGGEVAEVPVQGMMSKEAQWAALQHALEGSDDMYLKMCAYLQGQGANDDEGEDDDDEDDEEDDEDEDEDSDDDDEEEEEEEEEEDEPGNRGKAPHCVIEEITEEQQETVAAQPGAKRIAQHVPNEAPPNKKQKAPEPVQERKQQQQQQQQQQPKKQQQQQQRKEQAEEQTPTKDSSAAREVKTNKKNVRRFENGFEIEELVLGEPNGKLAKAGKKCTMKYVGRLKHSGKIFDQTQGKKTFTFRLGVGEVIKGWDLGVQGMRVGDKRRVVVPPQLGYGSSGVKGAIPPNATLEFDMELVDVK